MAALTCAHQWEPNPRLSHPGTSASHNAEDYRGKAGITVMSPLLFHGTKRRRREVGGATRRRRASGFFCVWKRGWENLTLIKPLIPSCDGEPISPGSGGDSVHKKLGDFLEAHQNQCGGAGGGGRAGARVCWRTLNNPEMCCSLSRLTEVRPVEASRCQQIIEKREGEGKKKNRSSWQEYREAASELGEAASTYTHLNTDCQYSAKILRNLPEQRKKINK